VGYLAKNAPVGGLYQAAVVLFISSPMSLGTLSTDAVRQRETEKLSRHFLLDRRLADDCPADWLLNRICDLTSIVARAKH
jgi:hypothetical protein